jgi:hypothetical protein
MTKINVQFSETPGAMVKLNIKNVIISPLSYQIDGKPIAQIHLRKVFCV